MPRPLKLAAVAALVLGLAGPAGASWRARADSLYAAGASRYDRGDYAQAAELFEMAIVEVEPNVNLGTTSYFSGLAARARFFAARSHERLEHWDAAAAGYSECLVELAPIDDVVRIRLAACYAGGNDHDSAQDQLRVVIDDDVETAFDMPALVQLAGYHEENDEFDVALQWYRVYLVKAESYDERALAHYRIGRVYELRGDEDEAKKSYATAVDDYPRSRHAHDALERARRLSRSFTDRYHQGLVLYNRKHYKDACEFFQYYLRHNGDREFDAEAAYFLGRSYQRRGSYRTAARKYEDAVGFGHESEYFDLAWSKLAYCRRATGRTEGSIDTYDDYLSLYPDREAAPEILWEKARLLEEKGRWDESLQAFTDLSNAYPESDRAADARFRAGLCLFKKESFDAAEWAFADIVVGAESEEAARALFWAGKCREHLSGPDEARARYVEATEAALDSYYGRKAQVRLRELGGAPRNPEGRRLVLRQGPGRPILWNAEMLDFAAWLAEWYDQVYFPVNRSALRRTMYEDPSFVRADIFLDIGMRDAALRELSDLEDTIGRDPRAIDILLDYCERMGLHKRAIRLAEKLLGMSPAESLSEAPVYLRKRVCPAHFSDIVERECWARDIDPMIEFSLIRQESLFEPDAVSWVGARGLSQIMPATGRWVARRLGHRGFRTSHLLDPEVNIRFGTEYFAVQIEEFDGDVLRALAAYNGGPESSERWWKYGGGMDSDVFVEDIGYSQTDDYVRRVFRFSEVYRELYAQ